MKTEGKMNTKNERAICGSAKVTVFFSKLVPKVRSYDQTEFGVQRNHQIVDKVYLLSIDRSLGF